MLRRQIFAILAAWGLFFQLLIMGLHIPANIALAGFAVAPSSPQSTSRIILICTKNGLKPLRVDENNQPARIDVWFALGSTCNFARKTIDRNHYEKAIKA